MAACCSINMRIFKTTELIFLLFFVVLTCNAAPKKKITHRSLNDSSMTSLSESAKPTIESSPALGDNYDQRQNGTENYRIHVDGLVVVVAPVEALLLAGGLPGSVDSNLFGNHHQQVGMIDDDKPLKPLDEPSVIKPKPEIDLDNVKDKSLDSSASHRPSLRIMSLLSPFLRRVQSHR